MPNKYKDEVDKILSDPKLAKALAEVHFENGRMETNLNPNVTPRFTKESPDHSLEPDPRMYPGGRVPPGRDDSDEQAKRFLKLNNYFGGSK